jgi:Glyoxalase-like domain
VTPAQPTVDEVVVAAEPASWSTAGFRVEDGVCEAGSVRVRLAGADAGRGILSWSVRGLERTEVDGLPTRASEAPPAAGAAHPNGVVSLDHLVVFTPDRGRTVAALEAAGLDLRRLREGPTHPGGPTRQAFFRMGEVILEVIEARTDSRMREQPDPPARFWGLAFGVEDLDRTARELGELLGEPRDAVQPGRRIATARREAGLGAAVAFITPGQGGA